MRVRLIEDIISGKRKVLEVADILGMSRQKVHKWKCRYINQGVEGLIPKKPGPRKGTNRNKIDKSIEDIVVRLARDHKLEGPMKLKMRLEDEESIHINQSTVWRILKRRKIRYHLEYARPKKKPKLYTLDTPGREVQLDTSFPFGYQRKFVVYSAIDDCTRIVRAKAYTSANLENSIDFVKHLREKTLINIKAFRTDQGREFSKSFTQWLKTIGIEHRMNAPYHPQHNGKVERYHRTMKQEEIRNRPYLITVQEANYMLRQREKHYNEKRRHTGLGMNGLTPKQKLEKVSKNVTLILQ